MTRTPRTWTLKITPLDAPERELHHVSERDATLILFRLMHGMSPAEHLGDDDAQPLAA